MRSEVTVDRHFKAPPNYCEYEREVIRIGAWIFKVVCRHILFYKE